MDNHSPKLGLALGGSGSRTSFYIGFLEVFDEQGVHIDYIAASSGASIVASAYACGALPALKAWAMQLNNESIKNYVGKGEVGGLYSLDGMESKLREFTKGQTFEEVRPHMSFTTVDIESGKQINICMGDIARACRASCTLPGVFEPVKWGSRTLVDGGLMNLVPLNALKEFNPDVTIGVDIPGTKFIFDGRQITLRKMFNLMKKMLFVEEIELLLTKVFSVSDDDLEKTPGLFSVLGRSMDLAIKANQEEQEQDLECDLLITPDIPKLKPTLFIQFEPYYQFGRECALANMAAIKNLTIQKQETNKIHA